MSTQESPSAVLAQTPAPASPNSESSSLNETLTTMAAFIHVFLGCSDHQAAVLALWIAHTYCFDSLFLTPYLEIFSPENQSGKSVCLRLLSMLCHKAWLPAGLNSTRLINRIVNYRPTLLLDNWNTLLRPSDSQSILGFLQAGARDESYYPVSAEEENCDRTIFCPKAFAGPGRLPASLAARCIPIALRRLKPTEHVVPLWSSIADDAEDLSKRISAWTEDHHRQLRQATFRLLGSPKPAFSLRQRELAAPLLAIADAAGGRWPKKARLALLHIFDASPPQPPSIGLQLLAAIREFFTLHHDPTRIHTAALLEYLNALEDRPWKKLTPNGLRCILQNFPIDRTGSQRIEGQNFKGYTFQHFVESWESYLPHLSSRRSTQQQPTPDQPGTDQIQVGTNDVQVGTNGSQVGTNDLQVGTNEPQVGTNSQPETNNPNVFNNPAEESINENDSSRS